MDPVHTACHATGVAGTASVSRRAHAAHAYLHARREAGGCNRVEALDLVERRERAVDEGGIGSARLHLTSP